MRFLTLIAVGAAFWGVGHGPAEARWWPVPGSFPNAESLQEVCEAWAQETQDTLLEIRPLPNPAPGDEDIYQCVLVRFAVYVWDQEVSPVCTAGEETYGLPATYEETGCLAKAATNSCGETIANPIDIASGAKIETVVDYTTGGPNRLGFVRYYNALTRQPPAGLGLKWRSNFDRAIRVVSTVAYADRPDGVSLVFTQSGANWLAEVDEPERLVQIASGWRLTLADDTVELYDTSGRLATITTRGGYQQTLAYDANGKLASVTDSHGRQLQFVFSGNRLVQFKDPQQRAYFYTYAKSNPWFVESDVLQTATMPDNAKTTYHYEVANHRSLLTGITDPGGARYATWTYDSIGRATSSQHAGGVDNFTLAYNADGSRTVTNPLGKQTIFNFTTLFNSKRPTSVVGQPSLNCAAANAAYAYDANGHVASTTDWNGNVTAYVHDARGLETSRTEASGTPLARAITTTWHATYRVPTEIVEPGRTTTYTYDAQGRVQTRTETDTATQTIPYTTNGRSRTWTYSWDLNGLLQSIDGPRIDVVDTVTFGWTNGLIASVTNALGHVTQITAHNDRGLPLSVTDANGVVIDLAYNQRGWLTGVTRGDAVTSIDYDSIGQITAITQPDGSTLTYEYSQARRLAAVENDGGERVEFTYDAMGNATAETIKSPAGAIVKSMTHAYDELGRLLRDIGAANQTTAYAYDKNGNVISVTDPLDGATVNAFDALDRLIATTDPLLGRTDLTYDTSDNLTSVADPRGIETIYAHDGFGNVIQIDSPDSGVTVYEYDSADNLVRQTDARAVVTEFSYDALNRITAQTFPVTPGHNIGVQYDDITPGNHGIGRLYRVTDKSGSTQYAYNARGTVKSVTRFIGAVSYLTSYAYDVNDRLASVTYPSGRIVDYQRDGLGRIELVTLRNNAAAVPVAVATGLQYLPFGPLSALTYGNGLTLTLEYDQDYRLTGLETSSLAGDVQDLTYSYDAAGNILNIADALDLARNQSFQYDALHRLTRAQGAYGAIDYAYDAVGNRIGRTVTIGAAVTAESYSLDAFSNRLMSVAKPGNARTLGYDAAGNLISDDRNGEDFDLAFDPMGRLSEITIDGLAEADYAYNAFGERVKKQPAGAPAAATHFQFDELGQLLAEHDAAGAAQREYVYIDGLPIALLVPASGGPPPAEATVDNTDPGAAANGNWTTATSGAGYLGANYHQHAADVPAGGTTVDNGDAGFSAQGVWTSAAAPTGFLGADYLKRNSSTTPPQANIITDNTDPNFSVTGTWLTSTAGPKYGANLFYKSPNEVSAGTQYFDNGAAGFSTFGSAWTTATSPTGFYGTNYLYRRRAPSLESLFVDNTDPGFSTVSGEAWQTSTAVAGYYGTNYSQHQGFGLSTQAQIVDNADLAFGVTGAWSTATLTGTYGPNHRSHGATLLSPPVGTKTIIDNGAPGTVAVGTWTTGTGSGRYGANYYYNASGSGADTYTWPLDVPSSGQYRVYAWWRLSYSYCHYSPYTIYHSTGSTRVVVNQATSGAQFHYLGNFTFVAGQNNRVVLGDDCGTGSAVADAVAFEPVGTTQIIDNGEPGTNAVGGWGTYVYSGSFGPNYAGSAGTAGSYSWTPNVTTTQQFRVYAWWIAHANHTTGAQFAVVHAGGSTPIKVNQQLNGSRFNYLGTFTFEPGQNHRVELSNLVPGSIADAVAFEPVTDTVPDTATWTLPVASAGDYRVYARWPAAASHAANAAFTVTHAGGVATVQVNQQADGGRWWLLGTFPLAPGQNHRVELSDRAGGTVIADAVAIDAVAAPGNVARWTPTLPASGQYRVLVRWTAAADRASDATYTVRHAGGQSTVIVNQKLNGGIWTELGTYEFTPGLGHGLELSDRANGYVVADVAAFESIDAALNKAIWTPPIAAAGPHLVWARWSAAADRATDAAYTITHAGGSSTVAVNQQTNGGTWVLLGSFEFAPGQNHRIELSDRANGIVVADAIGVEPTSNLGNHATWAHAIAVRDRYQVYGGWTSAADRATDARYTITHEGGTATVTVNQQVGGGQWQLLGTYVLAPNAGHKVQLSDRANGLVIADANRLVPDDAGTERLASWTGTAASAGDYRFYARWPAANDNAPDARYTVTHAVGASSVTRNQQANGGQWNLLGAYALNAGQAWRVDLSDQAHGNVVADAVYVVRDDAAQESFAWTIPALEAGTIPAGSYAVYARWTASSVNSSAAVYTVAHAGGTAAVTVNQKQNGGQWRLLGTYSFAPGAGHNVSLAAAADGRVVADAIRLVAASGPPADIVYIHPDQLGQPQKMTDGLRAVVWDRQAGPFGEFETIAGLAQLPLRFPGQYADGESSFNYNYFRDYDPALGRYIESDPIGLWGGLNTYAYVGGNPVNRSDPYGLWMGWDDAGAALGGAIFGVAAQGISDYFTGNDLCWQNYAGAAVGGAAGGLATLYGGIVVGGAVGGGATGLLQLGLNNLTGSCGCESLDPMWGAIGGAAGGYIGGKFLAPVLGRLFAPLAGKVPGNSLVPVGARPLGQWGEGRLGQVLGGAGYKPKTYLPTSLGPRKADRIVNGVAHEAKAGLNVGLTSRIRDQILKDAELISTGEYFGAHWHFFQGAQKGLLDFLSQHGIKYTVY